MAQFSMEIMRLTGSVLRGNQHCGKGLIGDDPTGALLQPVLVDFIPLNLRVFMDIEPDLW